MLLRLYVTYPYTIYISCVGFLPVLSLSKRDIKERDPKRQRDKESVVWRCVNLLLYCTFHFCVSVVGRSIELKE